MGAFGFVHIHLCLLLSFRAFGRDRDDAAWIAVTLFSDCTVSPAFVYGEPLAYFLLMVADA
jgi:hypothetical protein